VQGAARGGKERKNVHHRFLGVLRRLCILSFLVRTLEDYEGRWVRE
jgi:hypothetical protein